MIRSNEGPLLAGDGPLRLLRQAAFSTSDNTRPTIVPQSKSCALQPNKEQAEAFLHFLDPGADRFTFQTFDDNADRKAPRLARVLHGSLVEHWDGLVDLSQEGAGIFVCINETNGRGRKASDVVRIRALFADLDGASLSSVWSVPITLGWVTRTSPKRYRCYWHVVDIALDEFTALQKALIALTGSDRAVHDLPRVMRLPGFPNLKKGPFLVEGMPIDSGTASNTRDACRALLPPPAAPRPIRRPMACPSGGNGAGRRYALAALEKEACYVETAPHGERNATLNRAAFCAGTLVPSGDISADEIENVLTCAALNAGLHTNEIKLTLKSGRCAGMANPRRGAR